MQQPTQVGGEHQQPLVTGQHQLQQQSTQQHQQYQPQQGGAQQHQQHQPQVVIQTVPSGSAPNRVTTRVQDHALFPRSTAGKAIFWCSIIQILCAVMAIIFDSASIGLSSTINSYKRSGNRQEWAEKTFPNADRSRGYYQYYFNSNFYGFGFTGAGIWAGVFAILTASFGIAAGRSKRSKCLIITHMVLSIISAPLMTGIITSTSLVIGELGRCTQDDWTIYDRYAYICDDARWNSVRGLQIVELLCGIIIAVTCMISASFCCKAYCCCGSRASNRSYQYGGPPQQYAVAYQSHPGVGGYPQPGVGGYPQPVVSGYPQNMVVAGLTQLQTASGVPTGAYISPGYPSQGQAVYQLGSHPGHAVAPTVQPATATAAGGVESANEKPPQYETLGDAQNQ